MNLRVLAEQLARDAGKGTVRANLVKVARAALGFYVTCLPISASLFSTSDLRTKHRGAVRERGVGPRNPQRMLSRYLRAEQRLGRLPRATDVDAMAALLLGACFQQAFLISFEGEPPASDEFDALVKSLGQEPSSVIRLSRQRSTSRGISSVR